MMVLALGDVKGRKGKGREGIYICIYRLMASKGRREKVVWLEVGLISVLYCM